MATRKRKTVQELRKEREWSQDRLAKELGVSSSTAVNLDTRRHEPTLSTAQKVAEVFGVPLESIDFSKKRKGDE